jgi:hypothetical protein
MVVKKPEFTEKLPKITEKLPKGVKVRKGEKRKAPVGKRKEKDTKKDRRRYTAARCDGKEIVFEEGGIYYGGEIDTSEAIADVLSILKGKGML